MKAKSNFSFGVTSAGVSLSALCALLLSLFALDNLLLLQFLGLPPLLTGLLVVLLCPLLAMLMSRLILNDIIIPWRALAIAAFVSLALFMLGGQGRFFYANADWQVRDAVLADMARYPWPFSYFVDGELAILRAPIGLYLLPALAPNGWHEIAMLASNTLRLTLLMGMCWPLFGNSRDRIIALVIFLTISGFDIFGTMLFSQLGGDVSWDHLERWNLNNQFSSHITQAFWVPQHALAGWACAAAFLLWQRGYVKIGMFAAIIPLVALWSPLAIMGAIPFAILAGLRVLKGGDWNFRDIAIAAFAVAIAIPSLLYLQADAAKLGNSLRDISLASYLFLILLEVIPFILPLLLSKHAGGIDRATMWIILACLLLMPLYQIGTNSDFQMRASIMPLALLAIFFAQWAARLVDYLPDARPALTAGLVMLAIGSATPLLETARVFRLGPSPKPLCSLIGVWHKQQGLAIPPYASYIASVKALPEFMRTTKVVAGRNDPAKCWAYDWP
jgi:hypothetical protein